MLSKDWIEKVSFVDNKNFTCFFSLCYLQRIINNGSQQSAIIVYARTMIGRHLRNLTYEQSIESIQLNCNSYLDNKYQKISFSISLQSLSLYTINRVKHYRNNHGEHKCDSGEKERLAKFNRSRK